MSRGKSTRPKANQGPNRPRKVADKHKRVTVDTPLTDAEKVFVKRYLIDLNATQSYIAAHPDCAYSTARTEGSRMLAKANVRDRIDEELERRTKQYELSLENILREACRVAFADPAKLFNEDGSLKAMHELDEDTRRAIASVEVEALYDGRGEDREQVGNLHKIKAWPKVDALKTLLQYFGNLPNKDPKPGDPGTVTHFHTTIPFDKIRENAEKNGK